MTEKNKTAERETERSPRTDIGKNGASVAVNSAEKYLVESLAKEYGCEENGESVMRAHRTAKAKRELAARAREESARRRYEALLLEGEKIKELDAGFSLEAELKDPRFRKLVQCGFSLQDAWQFTHFDEIITTVSENAEKQGYEKAVQLLREGQIRPEENGTRESGSVTEKKSVSSLSGGNIREILSRVEKGAKIKF